MPASQWLARETDLTYQRLRSFLQARFATLAAQHPDDWDAFQARLRQKLPRLLSLLLHLYGTRYDFFYFLQELVSILAEASFERDPTLKQIDAERERDPHWFESNRMLAGVCYVDLFAGNLENLRAKIPYFQELGLTYLHLMPLFAVPEPENDGGYAVSSYREVNSKLGTMDQLRRLAGELHDAGIVLTLDFVFNHTAHDHEWAQRARAGDPEYVDYYFIFPDRTMPDAYDKNLREIFPDVRRGSFTYLPAHDKWVWTTFNSFQWDLNYGNPAVFNSMAREMLFLANQGVDVLRLDAVAFIWKKLGTSCENLPEAHTLIQAFNAVVGIAAPGMLFKSEAIVHPDDVVKYISTDECQISYNPLLMALLWNTLATREVDLLSDAVRHRFTLPPGCAWVNYVRVHDDIGWTFADEDAWRLGIIGYDHRRFLNRFYTGKFPGSFARGLPFQENPLTGDCRISGTCASLAGLEKALDDGDELQIEYSIRRILLIHGVILLIGGIPLLYLGDELGILNDLSYQNEPSKARDSRWVHRPHFDWTLVAQRHTPSTIPGRIFGELGELIDLRKNHAVFGAGVMRVRETDNAHLFAFERENGRRILVLANFSEFPQRVNDPMLRTTIADTTPLHGGAFLQSDGTCAPYGLIVLQ
jgi:amylosucrase